MKVKVNRELCIGCGACQAITDSKVFEIDDTGLAEVIVDEVSKDDVENVVDAIEGCPVSAISEIKE